MDITQILERIQHEQNAKTLSTHTLHDIVSNGTVEQVRLYLKDGSYMIDHIDEEGQTPLLLACCYSVPQVVQLLLDKDADVELASPKTLLTPLLAACLRGSVELARLLIDAGANVNAQGLADGTTPLIAACASGAATLVPLLLAHGADINATRRSDGATPFSVSWTNRHFDILYNLLATSPPQKTVDLMNSGRNHEVVLGIIRLVISSSASNTTSSRSTGSGSVGDTNSPTGGSMIGGRPTGSKTTAPSFAVVRLLISKCDFANCRVPEHLSELRSSLSQLLLVATSKAEVEIVRILLDQHKIDVNNASSGSADTPLILALRNGHLEIAHLLLSRGADPNATVDGVSSPLHVCIARDDLEGVKLLLSASADPNLQLRSGPHAGYTPLRYAMTVTKNSPIAQLLLCTGAVDVFPGATLQSVVTNRDLSKMALRDADIKVLLPRDARRVVALNLSSNIISHVDISTWRYPFLASLRLSNNKLKELPLNLRLLSNLTHLDLSDNLITDLNPLREDHPPRLNNLLLRANPLASLPLWMHRLSNLQSLELDSNANLGVPQAVLRLPTQDLLRFLQATESKSIRWNTAKLMLVGEENVGKTSLSQFLMNDALVDTSQPNVSTNGISISTWSNQDMQKSWRWFCSGCFEYFHASDLASAVRSSNDTPRACPKCGKGTLIADAMSLSVWDFGGQEVFYPTHSFFLSDRSIYLVVFDCTKDSDDRLEYWLRHINSLAQNRPPIILVGTHRDQRHEASVATLMSAIESKYRKPWCGNVRGVHCVSCVKRIGLDELRRLVLETATKLLSSISVPAYYIALRQLLNEIKVDTKDYMHFAVFEARARERIGHARSDDPSVFSRELKTALLFFSDCGLVLYFDTPELRDLIILDPKWLSSVLSTIITFRPNFVNKQTGLLSVADLRQLWRAYPIDLHSRLLAILTRFGIAYSLPSFLLFPDLVGDVTPDPSRLDAIWNVYETTRATYFEFGRLYRFEFLPLGFMSRVVIGMFHTFGVPPEYYLWKNGLVFWLPVVLVATPVAAVQVIPQTILVQFDPRRKEFALSLRATDLALAEKSLKTTVDVIEATISGFYATYSNQMERLLACSHCLQQNMHKSIVRLETSSPSSKTPPVAPTYFSLNQFANALLAHSPPALLCPRGQVPVALNHVAPDLALSDMAVLREVTTEKVLGKGGFGQVWKGVWNGRDVAVKELLCSETSDTEATQRFLSFQKEVGVMTLLQHPNLIRLYGVMLQPLRMIIELAPQGDLYHLLHDASFPDAQFSWRLRLRIALDIASGMHYLHHLTPPILHRDLRSPNIFLMSLDESADIVAKVADFGLAQKLVTSQGITDRLETWQWMAPEAFGLNARATYDERADVYSFGIVLWELSSRKHPFAEYSKMNLFKVKDGICRETEPLRPTIDRLTCPARVSSLIRTCWTTNPRARPMFFDICYSLRQALLAIRTEDSVRDGTAMLPTPHLSGGKYLLEPTRDPVSYVVSLHLTDGRLWTGASDGTVCIYEMNQGTLLSTWSGLHAGRVYKIIDLPRASLVVTVSEDRVVNLWSKSTLGFVAAIHGQHHSLMMRAIAAAIDKDPAGEELLWTSDAAGKINSWKITSNAGTRSLVKLMSSVVLSNGDAVCSMCQVQDGGMMVGCDGTLLKLDPNSMRELHRRPKVHRGKISVIATAQENLVITASEDYSIAIWTLSLEQLRHVTYHSGKVHALSVYQEAFLISGGFDLNLCLFDLRSRMTVGRRVWQDAPSFIIPNSTADSISAICCNTSTATVWVAARDGSLRMWHLESSQAPNSSAGRPNSPLWIRTAAQHIPNSKSTSPVLGTKTRHQSPSQL